MNWVYLFEGDKHHLDSSTNAFGKSKGLKKLCPKKKQSYSYKGTEKEIKGFQFLLKNFKDGPEKLKHASIII